MSRQRGVMVYPITIPESEKDTFSGDRYCFGINPNTYEAFVIHNPEGVSWYVGHNKPFRFNDHNAKCRFYTLYEILGMVDFTKPIDLADMIRTFGSRLESNFYMAHGALTDIEPFRAQESDKYDKVTAKFIIDLFSRETGTKIVKHNV